MLKITLLLLVAGHLSVGQFHVREDREAISSKFSPVELSLLKSLVETQPASTVTFSPFSIRTLLAMVKEGAKDYTKQVLNNNLGDTRSIEHSLTYPVKDGITFGNAVYLNNNHGIQDIFLRAITDKFKAIFQYIDFSRSDKAAFNINEFIKSKTNNQIPKFIDPSALSPDTVLMMVNAIHLAAKWKLPFDKQETRDGVFWEQGFNGLEPKLVPLMHRYDHYRMGSVASLNARVIEIPFKSPDRHAMYILLPNEAKGLKQMIHKMSPDSLKEIFESLGVLIDVYLYVPRFEVSLAKNLKDILPGELSSLFRGNADVSGISTLGNIQLNNILHKAILKVDEEGVTGSGASGIDVVNLSLHTPPQFNATHPFVYFVAQMPPDRHQPHRIPPSEIYFMGFAGRINEAKPVPSNWGPLDDPDVVAKKRSETQNQMWGRRPLTGRPQWNQ